ncbi:hypothetical protein BU24DRAFT_78531 [Aaosphaeria arxii CBS 175.79]|uniref:Secreted protein n=1 Tax=Aaosphaeria arxii CBS 175.79 TaxID=1450172 RepID=A0A6A5X9J0_9PLEO|nr:uncharacterized protein BU24DRAFT_78531 [Aaosphaeria arxii CBS 175.79]KAF2009580.1 hypothetical protein BU24DRAFT_78531 [Aaosphaeria arxii CBS 175.79]
MPSVTVLVVVCLLAIDLFQTGTPDLLWFAQLDSRSWCWPNTWTMSSRGVRHDNQVDRFIGDHKHGVLYTSSTSICSSPPFCKSADSDPQVIPPPLSYGLCQNKKKQK